MSTLNVNTVQSSTSNPPIFKNSGGTVVGTLCRAWVNFDGTGTVTIRDSFNVNSITDNGTGYYTVNFTTPMSNTNYAVVGGSGNETSFSFITPNAGTKTTTSTNIFVTNSGSIAMGDPTVVCVAIFSN